jgi:hypothetical protein
MHSTLKIFLLNARKQQAVQHSVINDADLREFGALALSEPNSFIKEGKVMTVPLGYAYWTKMTLQVHAKDDVRLEAYSGSERVWIVNKYLYPPPT